MLYANEKDIDYWLMLTWVGYWVYESCVEIPPRLYRHGRGHHAHDMTNFLLLSMNKKRDALDQYKMLGRDKMVDIEY
jgi:hypothetical protein